MRLSETLPLLRVARPPAPYGAHRLARCFSIEDVAAQARRRLPRGASDYLDGGGRANTRCGATAPRSISWSCFRTCRAM